MPEVKPGERLVCYYITTDSKGELKPRSNEFVSEVVRRHAPDEVVDCYVRPSLSRKYGLFIIMPGAITVAKRKQAIEKVIKALQDREAIDRSAKDITSQIQW